MSEHLPLEFHHAALIDRIVRGAVDDDPVRLHGAIFAALEIHGPASARDDVFTHALGAVQMSHSDRRDVMAEAIRQHLDHPPWAAA
ncbi:MAG TPA: hypothetical protein VGI72_10070 [Gaiellales bacterium]